MNAALTGLVVFSAFVCAVWVLRLFLVYRAQRDLIFLSEKSPRVVGDDLPVVSVLVPARNEETTIADCVRSLLAQDYPKLELIVIDDRSTDRTGEIVAGLAARDPRIQVESVRELPGGWTGKTHALHTGVQRARGEWFLFVDADTRHHAGNLRVLLRYALDTQADLVSLLPRLACISFWEKVVQPLAGIILMLFFPFARVNSERWPRSAFANGQYLLIRRTAYEQVGGHAAVRSFFVEDINLARRVKEAGLRLRVVMAPELTLTRMYTSLGEIVRGWSRIFYGAVDHRPWKLVAILVATVVFSVSVYGGLLFAVAMLCLGDMTWQSVAMLALNLASYALMAVVLMKLYAFNRTPRQYFLLHLPACLLMLWILGRASWLCFTHRVTWRDTSYGPDLRTAKAQA